MSARRQSIVAGLCGLLVAAAIIGAVTYFQLTPSTPVYGSQGTFSVAVTDPPTAPAGVTAAYVSYADVQVHIGGDGNSSGWYTVASQGTLELFSLVNISQTIGTAPVPQGVYNMVKFNVTGATVTYDGANYTAFIPSGEFRVAIAGGLNVTASSKSGVLLDLTPTIANIGSQSLPEFIITPTVHMFAFPHGDLSSNETEVGDKVSLNDTSMKWFAHEDHGDQGIGVNITSASLSPSSLSLTILNSGNESVSLRMVTVSLVNTSSEDSRGASTAFLVMSNGTLLQHQIMAADTGDHGDANSSTVSGYSLAACSAAVLAYNGSITFVSVPPCADQSPACMVSNSIAVQGIVSGQQYLVTVIGDGTVATAVVTAA